MHLFWGTRADPHTHAARPDWIHPALIRFADECSATFGRLILYVGALALLVIAGVHLWQQLPDAEPSAASAVAEWSPATRSLPAFAVSQPELVGKTATYDIFRHPGGGRKDILRWAAPGEKPVAELEIYRPGAESNASAPPATPMEAAGVIESKFGPVTLLRIAAPAGNTSACVYFVQHLDAQSLNPDLKISGWSCQGDSLPARRTAIGCILNRLTLLTAGNDPKLADLFAQAELRRGGCKPGPESVTSASWVTETENPRLRGAL